MVGYNRSTKWPTGGIIKLLNFDENIYIYYFIAMAAVIIGICIIIVARQWLKNKRSPRIVVQATIVDLGIHKYHRQRDRYAAPGRESVTINLYYAIFSLDDGEQIELRVSKLEYYKLKKGYIGTLTFQGTKYISFEKS